MSGYQREMLWYYAEIEFLLIAFTTRIIRACSTSLVYLYIVIINLCAMVTERHHGVSCLNLISKPVISMHHFEILTANLIVKLV